MKQVIALILFFSVISWAPAQKSTYFGLEFGPKYEVYQYSGSGEVIYTKPSLDLPVYGFNFSQELNKSILLETGLLFVDYSESYRFRQDYPYFASNAVYSLQIPLRIRSRIQLIKDKLSLTSTVGISANINTSYGSWGYLRMGDIQNPTFLVDTANYSLQKSYPLLEGGIGLSYTFKKGMILNLNSQYFYGLQRVVDIDVYYAIDGSPTRYVNVFSNGDYFSFTLGLKYPISNFWNSKSE